MAFVIGNEFNAKIRATFDCETSEIESPEGDEVKLLFKEHKRLVIKSLNRKWNILSL